MGLDNGIILKHKHQIDFPPELFSSIYLSDTNDLIQDGNYETSITYWRKCWNIRTAILVQFAYKAGEYEIELNADDLITIAHILDAFNENNWDDGAGSIWAWDEYDSELDEYYGMKYHLASDIKALYWISDYMKKHPENIVECYFYDSY